MRPYCISLTPFFFIVKTYIVKTTGILCTLQGSHVEMTSLKALSLVTGRMQNEHDRAATQ